jgi:hypothetical protein
MAAMLGVPSANPSVCPSPTHSLRAFHESVRPVMSTGKLGFINCSRNCCGERSRAGTTGTDGGGGARLATSASTCAIRSTRRGPVELACLWTLTR